MARYKQKYLFFIIFFSVTNRKWFKVQTTDTLCVKMDLELIYFLTWFKLLFKFSLLFYFIKKNPITTQYEANCFCF
jgi:hypothetical protein